jgi:tRNA A37 methylthiotransferase MiaB
MRICPDSVGCRVNLSEVEASARHLSDAGHDISASAEACDLAIVNLPP